MTNYSLAEINKLQVPTWRALKINGISIGEPAADMTVYAKNPIEKNYRGIEISRDMVEGTTEAAPLAIRDVKNYVKDLHSTRLHIRIPEGHVMDEPIILNFKLDRDNALLIDDILISAADESKATIVFRYTSEEDADCFRCGFTALEVGRNADIRLIKTQLLSHNHKNVDATMVNVAEKGHANIILAELGGEKSVSGYSVQLLGEAASADLDSLYMVNRQRELDINYRMAYQGKSTEGHINVKGALLGKAKKTAKSTLDFISGAANAKGHEEETVLTFSPDVINISAPLLLCGEDNVSGQHATSVGRPDADKLFYLMSRGISKEEAEKLIALAAFSPIINSIEPEELREEMITVLQEVMDNAEELC